jgi:hypothetical protein
MPTDSVLALQPVPGFAQAISAMPPFGVGEIRKRTHAVQEVMRGVMKEGTHFGTIPGTPKPSLWKPGAEVLCMTFRLAPLLESHTTADDPDAEWGYQSKRRDGTAIHGTCIGFFEIEATCTVQNQSGEILSRCSARCNNREAKYRSLSIYDVRNTIQKMAEKRAFVSAVLMATGASDIFTQDIEDFPELVEATSTPAAPIRSEGAISKEAERSSSSSAPLSSPSVIASKPGQALTARREEWLRRVAQDAHIHKEAMDRCLDFLKGAEPSVVKRFFDELAQKKAEVFRSFLAA